MTVAGNRYDRELFLKAQQKCVDSPETLTDDEIAQLAYVSRDLGDRAVARRAGVFKDDTEEFGVQPLLAKLFFRWLRDYYDAFAATVRVKTDELNQRIASLERGGSVAKDSHASGDAALMARIAALEERLERAEKRGLEYRGVFTAGVLYRKGDACTHAGSLWIAIADETVSQPGTPDAAGKWQLGCKRGRDGKDGRGARS